MIKKVKIKKVRPRKSHGVPKITNPPDLGGQDRNPGLFSK